MAGRDLFAADTTPQQTGGRDLFAPQPTAQAPALTAQPSPHQRPSMVEMFDRYRAGEFNPTQAAAFEELTRRQLGQPTETRGIAAGSPYAQEQPQEQLTPRQQAMKELAGEIGPIRSFLIGAGEGMTTIGRGVGLVEPAGEVEREAMEALEAERPISTMAGQIAGEAAPFLIPGVGVEAGLAKFAAGKTIPTAVRALSTGITAASEGGIIQTGRGEDAITGAGIGGAFGVGAEILFPVLGKLGGKVVRRVTGKPARGAMLDAAGKPTPELQQALNAEGLTFSDLTQDATDVLQKSAGLDPSQVARKEFLEAQGVTPTRAQVTREAAEFQSQQEAVKTSGRAREAIENQEAVLTTRFNDAVTKTGGASDSPVNTVIDAVVDKATALDRNISDLYRAAREAAPGEKNVRFNKLATKLREMAPANRRTGGNIEAIVGDLKTKGVLGDKFKIKGKIDVETAEDVRKLMNELYDPQNSYGNSVLRELKEALDDDVFKAAGDDVYKAARKAKSDFESGLSRAKVSKFDSRKKNIVRDMLENKVHPDKMIDDVVFSKTVRTDDLQQLKDYISDVDTGAFDDLRAETMQAIKERSFIGPEDASGFKALSRDRLENTLNKIGWEKLGVLFEAEEVKFLRNMLKVAKLREPVRGTALGKGPSAQAIAQLEKSIKGLPILGSLVEFINYDAAGRAVLRAKPARRIVERGAATKALPGATAAGLTAVGIEMEQPNE